MTDMGKQVLRYAAHLLAVYAIVHFTSLWLAGRVHDTLLPLLQHPSTSGRFEFAFSHLFFFSFFPAIIVAFLNLHWFGHRAALWVWVIPALILAYKFMTFPNSVLESHFVAAYHQFFAGGFLIPESHSYQELFQIMGSNPDMPRGMQQLNYTAPLYAAIGYTIGAWLALRFPVARLASLRPRFHWGKSPK